MRIAGWLSLITTLLLLALQIAGQFFSHNAWLFMLVVLILPAVGVVLLAAHKFLGRPAGIHNDFVFFQKFSSRGLVGWVLGILMTGFYIGIYFGQDIAIGSGRHLEDWLNVHVYSILSPLSQAMFSADASNWFVYSALYTWFVVVFAIRMLMKYRHNVYQIYRTITVSAFQLGFGFLVPSFLKVSKAPEYYFSYFWPLKPEYLWPDKFWEWLTLSAQGNPGIYFLAFSAVMSFIAVPVMTFFYGKRWYCSWVCGCGGLAETLGDPFRQLSSKSTISWKIERWMIHLVLVLVISVTVLLWLNSLWSGAILNSWSKWGVQFYSFFIVSMFSGVIGVGFYPWLGSRVWCRFGCPMAAILGIIQRFFSRFRITVNGEQCISCGNCSTYCEMGIDVKWYAQRNQNIVRASCVGCGICAAVCPRGVLKLENGPLKDRIPEPGTQTFH